MCERVKLHTNTRVSEGHKSYRAEGRLPSVNAMVLATCFVSIDARVSICI